MAQNMTTEELAIKVVRYFKLHEISNKVLLQDPNQRDELSARFQEQGLEVPTVAGAVQNQEEALKYYDEMVLLMPETFEESVISCPHCSPRWTHAAITYVATGLHRPLFLLKSSLLRHTHEQIRLSSGTIIKL